jgi:hypothetical protein
MMLAVVCVLAFAAALAYASADAEKKPQIHDLMRRTVPMHDAVHEHELLFTPTSKHFDMSVEVLKAKRDAEREERAAVNPGGGLPVGGPTSSGSYPVNPSSSCSADVTQLHKEAVVYGNNEFVDWDQDFVRNLSCAGDITGGAWRWFRWDSGPDYGTAEVFTCGLADFDTTLLVLWSPVSDPLSTETNTCDNLQCATTQFQTLAFNDDWKHGQGKCSRTTFAYAPGQIYYILVGSYNELERGSFGFGFRRITESDAALLYEWREDLSCAADLEFQTPDYTSDENDRVKYNGHPIRCINWFNERDIMLWEGLGAGPRGLSLINLNAHRIKGPISVRLNELKHVLWLDLAHNAFGPTVPEWAMHLKNRGFDAIFGDELHSGAPYERPVDNYYCALNDNAFDCCNVPDDVKEHVRRFKKDRNLAEFIRILGNSQCFIDPKVYLSCEFHLSDAEAHNLADVANRYGHQLNARGWHGWDETLQRQVKAHYCSWNGLDVLPPEFANNAIINFFVNSGSKRSVDESEHNGVAVESFAVKNILARRQARVDARLASLTPERRAEVTAAVEMLRVFHEKRDNTKRQPSGDPKYAPLFRNNYPEYYFPYFLPSSFNSDEMVVVSLDWRGANLPSQPLVLPTRGFRSLSYCDMLGNAWQCPMLADHWDSGCFDHGDSPDFYYGWLDIPCPREFGQAQTGFFH